MRLHRHQRVAEPDRDHRRVAEQLDGVDGGGDLAVAVGRHGVLGAEPERDRSVRTRQALDAEAGPGEHAVRELPVHQVHRGGADEPRHERVAGAVVDLLGRPHLLDDPPVHDHDPIGEGHRLDLVMGDVDRRHLELVLEVLDLGPGRDPKLGVEVRQRLVHQEHGRFADDGAGQGNSLALAAGELRRLAVEEIGELHHLRRTAHPLVVGGRIDLSHLQGKADVLVGVHVGVETVGLEHHGDVPVLRIEVVDDPASDDDVARGRLLQPGDHAHRGRLSAPRGTEEHEELPVSDGQVEVVDPDEVTPALGDVAQLNFGHPTSPCDGSTCGLHTNANRLSR